MADGKPDSRSFKAALKIPLMVLISLVTLSTCQAFRHTGFKAMAYGCVVLLPPPKKDGVHEYAVERARNKTRKLMKD